MTEERSLETAVRARHISLMRKTIGIMENLLAGVSQEQATSWRDGGDGWTIVEVLCHLRDFDTYFHLRAMMMVDQEHPQLPAYDHEALAVERDYNSQQMETVLAELKASREMFVQFFRTLRENQWRCTGVHPEAGFWTMDDALMQVGHHDVAHIEQLSKILRGGRG